MTDATIEAMAFVGNSLTDSPIEAIMLVALSASASLPKHWEKRGLAWESDLDFFVLPQFKVGQYRADFLVASRGLPHCRVLVECDGHQFHEKTPEQAERDKRRDRELQAEGYPVLRFTGREIHRSPFDCSSEVVAFLVKLVADHRMASQAVSA